MLGRRFTITAVAAILGIGFACAAADVPLDFTKAANRGFRSEPHDRALPIGWTNDGPGNDLRQFPVGDKEFGGVRFRVIDPKANQGKAVVAVAGLAPRGAMSVTIPVNRAIGSSLYLLHAASWIGDTSRIVGKFIVNYADGNVEGYDVNRNQDISDWWDPLDKANAKCVWTGRNPSAHIGVFVSGFPIENKPIRSIEFQAQSNVGWMLIAASGSAVPVKTNEVNKKYVTQPGDEWSPISYPQAPKAGSVLDFSFLLEAPAGKFGALVVRDGHFEFADRPGKKVRFYGTNLCESTGFLEHDQALKQAQELAAIGYNCVRLHHYENSMLKENPASSLDYDPKRFDQLDYQLFELKKRGIYVTLDAFCSREFRPGEVAGLEHMKGLNFHHIKQLFPIHKPAMENLKEHLRIFLGHYNPYTKMRYADDPAFVTLSLINENEIFGAWQLHPEVAKLYTDAFEAELKEKKLKVDDKLERSRIFAQFLARKQREMNAELKRFVREELKSNILITDNNAQYSMLHNLVGERLDFVDSHVYFDHPWFPEVSWRLPEQLSNVTAVEQWAKAPREIFANRIIGKPFTVTEFNFCFPNQYRAESGPVMGGYSALQDFDGIFRFDYIYNRGLHGDVQKVGGLSSGNDPACIISEKIGLLFFLREDVKPARNLYALVYGESFLSTFDKPLQMTTAREWNTTGLVPDSFTRLGLMSRVGSINIDQLAAFKPEITAAFAYHKLPGSGLPLWGPRLEKKYHVREKEDRVYRSDTGELEMNLTQGTFKVETPRSAALTMAWTREGSAGPMLVRGKAQQRTVALASLDDAPLAKSDKLLFFHLTSVYNTGTVFGDKTMRRLESIGDLPMLVHRDTIEVELALENPGRYEVAALDLDGSVKAVMPSAVRNGKLVFAADSAARNGSFLYWIRPKKTL